MREKIANAIFTATGERIQPLLMMERFARDLPEKEWGDERDAERIAQMLNDSAQAVRDALKSRIETGREMNLHYDHPLLMLQHLRWHEGYYHGQIKLALKLAVRPKTEAVYNAATMEYQVFVEQHANNGYVAEVIGLPNCQAVGETEEEAVTKAKETLAERLAHGKVVTINIEPETTPEEHPMLKGFGRFKDDPTFDDLMERIAEYRRQLDEEDAAE